MLACDNLIIDFSLGDYVTLGALERLDIHTVVQYLRDEG